MNRVKFEEYVVQAIDELPDFFHKKLNNVDIVVEQWPSKELMRSMGMGKNSILLGLYQGIPMTRRSSHYGLVLPDKITLFQGSIEKIARTEQAIVKQIRATLIHEIAHHFGMDEQQIRDAERGN